MLTVILTFTLLLGAQCIPLEEQVKVEQPQQPAVLQQEIPQQQKPVEQPIAAPPAPENPNLVDEQPAPPPPQIEGGAPPPGDLAESPDASPVERSGTSDLDTDATFGFGWGYRPYSRWGGYYGYPSWGWRRHGWGGRGYYGGWGWGGWGGRGWGGRYYW